MAVDERRNKQRCRFQVKLTPLLYKGCRRWRLMSAMLLLAPQLPPLEARLRFARATLAFCADRLPFHCLPLTRERLLRLGAHRRQLKGLRRLAGSAFGVSRACMPRRDRRRRTQASPIYEDFCPRRATSPLLSSVPLLKVPKLSFLNRIQYTSGGRLFGLLRPRSLNGVPRNRAGPPFFGCLVARRY